jgi:hypothetical protein
MMPQPFLEQGSSARKARANRSNRNPEDPTDLSVPQSFDIAQHDSKSELLRQFCDRSLNVLVHKLVHHLTFRISPQEEKRLG